MSPSLAASASPDGPRLPPTGQRPGNALSARLANELLPRLSDRLRPTALGDSLAQSQKRPLDWMTATAFLFVLAAVCVQFRIGWIVWGSNLASSDPPAHFTTGVMVYEYLRHALFSDPMAFARSFYVRFPKVALGHWPPVYYALQAVAYAILGPSIQAARVLSECICFALAFVLFTRAKRLYGTEIAALCAACFLVLPVTQGSAWLVMSDLLVALFM